jgi:hypothetical protein
MARKHLSAEDFPTVYENGQPIAVLVDLPTFQALVSAAEQLDQLDLADEAWIREVVERVRAYRQQHSDALMTFDTPEAALAAPDSLDD